MTPLHLTHIDPSRNMHRFYRLEVQPDLFGGILLMREWGRIGAGGRVRFDYFDDQASALVELERIRLQKIRRGYSSDVRRCLL